MTYVDEGSPLEDAAKAIAAIYEDVTLADFPIFRWIHVVNDATILGEDIRRNRSSEAIARTGRIVMRLFDYLGYYLHRYPAKIKKAADAQAGFPAFISERLCRSSFGYPPGTTETITHWIRAKYPNSCSKCGEAPCQCVLRPWVFEDRRENATEFLSFRQKVDSNRASIQREPVVQLTTLGMFQFFGGIYRNSYHNQDAWKLTMHLTEELGEATTELSRLELAYLARVKGLDLPMSLIEGQCSTKIGAKKPQFPTAHAEKIQTEIDAQIVGLKSERWDHIATLAARQFKEEIADVLSWLSAILMRLTAGKPEAALKECFEAYRGNNGMQCCYCYMSKCSNNCLLSHAAANELVEAALHM
jgi:hypothetical protein